MRKSLFAVAATACVALVATAEHPRAQTPKTPVKMAVAHATTKPAAPAGPSVEEQNKLVATYCAGCHSERTKAGELVLAGFDAATIDRHAETSEKMIRKLRAGMMPPPGARRPDAAAVHAFVDAMETRLDKAAALNPNPGWRPFQRLNRVEYARAIHDLLAIDVDVNSFLPPDTLSSGFDNISDVQTFSPT